MAREPHATRAPRTLAMGDYSLAVLGHSPAHYWRMNEPSGLVFFDQVQTNSIPLQGFGGVTPGYSGIASDGGSCFFNGSNGKTIWNVNGNWVSSPMTVQAWVYPTAWTSFPQQGIVVNANGVGLGFSLSVDATGRFFFSIGFGGAYHQITATNPSSTFNWHQVVGEYDGVSIRLYVDGVAAATPVAVGGYSAPNSVLEVGCNQNASFFNGFITEVAIYPTAIPGADLLYLQGLAALSNPASPALNTQLGSITSAISTVQTVLNRIVPPIISSLHISTTHNLTGVGTLNLTGRGVVVSFDFVPAGWGYQLGLINVFENRLAQLEFANLLGDGVTEVPSAQYEQYENIRVYLFSDNVPLTLNYYVAPGAGIVVRQITN